jgi:transposase InsO family protein
MSFWRRGKGKAEQLGSADTGQVQKAKRTVKRSPAVALEVKLLAMEALQSDLSLGDVAEIIGVTDTTLGKWRQQYQAGGVQGLSRRASSIGVRHQCSLLEERILAHRKEHPEHGVRRIRDELHRSDGLSVSAEKVRTVVNDAGLGNPPPAPHRRSPQIRRFERPLPNAMWQIDIFTFQLKRMYRVYLIGIIDDHSRFIVGWGLFRQQGAEAVLEVLKGAIGQWGAPREILSDNGRQFVAWRGETRFQRVLKQQGIQHVRSAPHHPMTLGKIERFWQTLWREFLCEAVFASFADACQRIDHWISYYNHQRPHQGIDGACPADRFYGMAEDVDEALRQGCKDNALRLALGQEPQQPLYLLGQLGDTDVRVMRKGEDIEVKVGEAVREVIRLGAPFMIREDGSCTREGQSDEVAGAERRGALPGGGVGSQGGGIDNGAVPDLRSESSDVVSSAGGSGSSCDRRARTEETWSQATPGVGDQGAGVRDGEGGSSEGAVPLAPEVRGGQDGLGSSETDGTRRGVAWGGGGKKQAQTREEAELSGYDERRWPSDGDEGGAQE